MSPEEKKLERLNALFELVNQDFATPDDLIQLSEAILAIITNERERQDTVIAKNASKTDQALADTFNELVKRETSLTRLVERLKADTEQNLSGEIARTTNSLAKELKRLERKIPSKTDLSGLEGEIQALKGQLNTLPTEITLNNEAIRDGLELLQGDERLDKSAIKGLDDWEEIATLARSPKTIVGAGIKLLRHLSDVNIEGITNGQTIIWNSTLSRFEAGTAGASSPLTNKGDLYTRTTVDARLAVGTDGQVLSSDSTQPTGLKWIALAGGGDMLLAAAQTVSALKTYLAGTLGLRNVANTFTSFFTNTNTASRTYTLKDADGTIAFTSDITGTNSGTNTGDQTTIVGITGTKAQFDTAVSDGNIQYVGDAPTAHTHLLAAGATDVTVTAANLNILDDGLNTTLHFHDADRARANHAGSQLAATISDFASTVLATVLTGISFITGTAVVATDSILVAIGKLQKQNTDQDTAINLKANLASPTFTGTVTVPTPTNATDAVTKGYADAITQSLDIKQSVRVASTVNIAVATALVNASTIDGVAVATGDRVLLKNQTLPAENGIYTVVASGAAPRAIDADVSADVTTGMYVFVSEGTISADMGYVLTTNDPITLGTTGLVFTQFSGAGQITVDSTLVKTGNQLKRAPVTGDITIPDASNASTLATVNANVGSFGLAASVSQFTVNAKGLITAAANVAISITSSAITDFAATVRGTVLTGLSLVSTTVISATDTVLVALGSLQAQITALTSTVAAKVASVTAGTNVTVTGTATAPMVNVPAMTATVGGAVPTPPNNTTTFLRGDGTFAVPAGGGSTTNYNYFYIDQAGGTSDTYGVLAGTRNGANAVFTVAQAVYATGTLKVWRNGQLLTQGSGEDWTETTPASGTFTFIVAPAATDEITVTYQKVVAGTVFTPYAEVPTGTVNSANLTFTLANTPAAAMGVIVVLDGITQYYTEDYTVSGTTITFVVAPTTGSTIYAYYNTASSISQASIITSYRAVTATTTFLASDHTINCTSGTFTVNLPTAVGRTGQIFVIKNSGAGTITLDGSGAETIDGAATQTISAGTAMTVQSTNAGWIII